MGWYQDILAQETPLEPDNNIITDSTIIKVVIDTIYIESNSFVFTTDSVFFTEKDTVLYVTDTIHTRIEEILKQAEGEEQEVFYNKLKTSLEKRQLGERIFDWVFDLGDFSSSTDTSKTKSKTKSPPEKSDHTGKHVGNIYFKQIDVFGPNVTDTTRKAQSKISRFYNALHIHTHDRVLKNNLLLDKGDVITPTRLADNERLIRSLRFIQDARLIVQPRADSSDTVDLLLITEDIIPYSFGGEADGFIEGEVQVNNVNMLGTGHELSNKIIVEPDEEPIIGYEGRYRIPNIRGSFIEGEFRYLHTMRQHIRSVRFDRRFVVPRIRYAGGLAINYDRLTALAPWVNSYQVLDTFSRGEDIPFIRYGIFNQDYWLGRSFGVKSFDDRTRFVGAVSYNRQRFFERPVIAADTNSAFHNRTFVIGGLGFSKRYYTTEKLVYTYARTEDIPIGQLAEINFGKEYGEFYDRFYTGVSYYKGGFIRAIGYVSASADWGGFWRNKKLEDGLFRFTLNSFSYLIHRRRTQFRMFLRANYTRGVSRTQTIDFRYQLVTLRDGDGIRGLSSSVMEGNERLAISLESVAYPPINIYSFRLACFVFADAGLIAQPGEEIFNSRSFRGYGFGFRVRNENLAFKTFQMRFAFYPRSPYDESWFGFEIGSIPIPNFLDFDVRKPQVFRFR